ncbi:DMT family transporter [Demequina sp. NBRC 110057]|uniref:DMT family transporter n=1 Tax=Demequina sp. NBRC 110057 TaxID=1570346 RepID=UPI000A0552EF|nr:DMT family transporter [Demequina sp. NBRC 110057]
MRSSHFGLVVLAAVLWGTGGVLGALLAEHSDVPAPSIAMWRMLIAGLALIAVLAVSRTLGLGSLTPAMRRRILITGALTALFEVAYFGAVALAGVSLATLVTIGSAPLWVAVADAAVGRVRPAPRTVAALALALAGLAALLGTSIDAGQDALTGVAVALAAGAAFASLTFVNRRPVAGLTAVRLTALSFTAGGVMLLPVAGLGGWGVPSGTEGWGYALALGVVSTACAYVAYLAGLATVPAFVATIVSLLEPLVAAVLGALVLGERIGPWGAVGGAALAGAVVLLRPQRDRAGSDLATPYDGSGSPSRQE